MPSRSTTATSCSIVAVSSSRARAMNWPETRKRRTAAGVPSSRARSAYFFTSGEAVLRIVKSSTFSSSACAVYCVSSRKVRSALAVPASRALVASRATPVPLLFRTVSTATRRSVVTGSTYPSFR